MEYGSQVKELCEAVEHAQAAVYHSQELNDTGQFQHAQQLIAYVNQLLFELKDVQINEKDSLKVKHAREMIRHLQETQASLQ
ncbi:hypothetical protein [Bacillus sp. Marseille-Q1617]|uniref:hypothetical protein n=1 Tax=Bacillus sp. Marseille-Q1617 TaxID=2736887 RepID=UPI00158CA672|nr:hypothetical protein [Bacillus sp. Marseille-Q1617]